MGNDDAPPGIDLRIRESVVPFIEQLVQRVTGWRFPINPETDFFKLDLDSLHVLRLVRAMQFALSNLSIRK
jgi:acyl carrier protein